MSRRFALMWWFEHHQSRSWGIALVSVIFHHCYINISALQFVCLNISCALLSAILFNFDIVFYLMCSLQYSLPPMTSFMKYIFISHMMLRRAAYREKNNQMAAFDTLVSIHCNFFCSYGQSVLFPLCRLEYWWFFSICDCSKSDIFFREERIHSWCDSDTSNQFWGLSKNYFQEGHQV